MSWFPKLSPDGSRIVSGAGEIHVDGHSSGVRGWNPVWLDNQRIAYNAGPAKGLQRLDLQTRQSTTLDPRELIELAAGGGVWAGRHAATATLCVSDGRRIPGAGQPSIATDGTLIYRQGDDKIEPSICLTAQAWGNGRGRIIGGMRGHPTRDMTVGTFEARPVLVDTPGGPWLLTMTHDSFHLRPLFSDQGYAPPPSRVGRNRNLHADARYVQGMIRVVWQDDRGTLIQWHQDLAEPRVVLGQSLPEDPMPEPESLLSTVKEVFNRRRPTTVEGYGAVVNEVAWIHRDKGWGLSKKPDGHRSTQPRTGIPIAYDILHHKPTDTLWDCLGPSEDPKPTWGQAAPHGRDDRPWVAPVDPAGSQPDVQSHPYDGGLDDAGPCNQCGRDRHDPIHQTVEPPEPPEPLPPTGSVDEEQNRQIGELMVKTAQNKHEIAELRGRLDALVGSSPGNVTEAQIAALIDRVLEDVRVELVIRRQT